MTGVVMGLVMGNVTGIMMGMGIVHFQDRLDVLDRLDRLDRQSLDSASTAPRRSLDSSTARQPGLKRRPAPSLN